MSTPAEALLYSCILWNHSPYYFCGINAPLYAPLLKFSLLSKTKSRLDLLSKNCFVLSNLYPFCHLLFWQFFHTPFLPTVPFSLFLSLFIFGPRLAGPGRTIWSIILSFPVGYSSKRASYLLFSPLFFYNFFFSPKFFGLVFVEYELVVFVYHPLRSIYSFGAIPGMRLLAEPRDLEGEILSV